MSALQGSLGFCRIVNEGLCQAVSLSPLKSKRSLNLSLVPRAQCSSNMDIDVESQNTPKPHDFLWFSDGSVVLATDLYLFKVHKSLLSLHSSVFKDMFEPPNMDDSVAGGIGARPAQEMYQGLPLVILVGDKGEDVAHLLRAVFEPRCVL